MNLLVTIFTKLTEVEHDATAETGWFDEYLALLQDPAHILFEITIGILFDLIIVYVGYQLIVKRLIIPRLRRDIHKEIDDEHGIKHHTHAVDDTLPPKEA